MTLKSRLTTTFLAALAVAALIVTVTPAEAGGTDAGTRPTGVETNQSCEAQVAEQKLSGAEKESFMEKCQRAAADATAAIEAQQRAMQEDNQRTQAAMEKLNQTAISHNCEAQAAEQKLSGADKESFMEKCHADNTRHDILMGITKDIR
jgi:hypothetical protein